MLSKRVRLAKCMSSNSSTSKIKHEFICNDFQNGRLNNIDIATRIASLQRVWIRRIYDPEAVVRRCSVKWVFLEISQNSQKNTCARASFLIKLHASGLQLY